MDCLLKGPRTSFSSISLGFTMTTTHGLHGAHQAHVDRLALFSSELAKCFVKTRARIINNAIDPLQNHMWIRATKGVGHGGKLTRTQTELQLMCHEKLSEPSGRKAGGSSRSLLRHAFQALKSSEGLHDWCSGVGMMVCRSSPQNVCRFTRKHAAEGSCSVVKVAEDVAHHCRLTDL